MGLEPQKKAGSPPLGILVQLGYGWILALAGPRKGPNGADMNIQKVLIFMFMLTCPLSLWAKDRQQLNYSILQNYQAYQYSKLDPTFSTVKKAYGVKANYLIDFGPELWYGGSYSRIWGSGSDSGYPTMMQAEFMEGVFEYFAGDREKMAQKGPFWEKLYFRAGASFGTYKWLIQHKKPSMMTELQIAPVYFSSGYTWAPYAAIGLGMLGSLEYTYRSHLSGAADMSFINNTYLSYVYSVLF